MKYNYTISPPSLTSYSFYINHCYKHIQMYQHIYNPVEFTLLHVCLFLMLATWCCVTNRGRLILSFSTVSFISCSSSSDGSGFTMPHLHGQVQCNGNCSGLFRQQCREGFTGVSALSLPEGTVPHRFPGLRAFVTFPKS